MSRRPPRSTRTDTLFPYTSLFRSGRQGSPALPAAAQRGGHANRKGGRPMSLKARVIPCLDVKDGRVVKGVNFVDLIDAGDPVERSEEHTSELQSLMRISYAVLCLKKQNITKYNPYPSTEISM